MRLAKTFQMMVVITALALIYTHLQMQIFNLAYEGTKKEKTIVNLSGNNGLVAYDIMQLKSSNHLGFKLLSEDSELRFSDNDNIVQLVTAESFGEPSPQTVVEPGKKPHPLLSLLSLRTEAEARTAERRRLVRP